jgi:ectoine hydroxylase
MMQDYQRDGFVLARGMFDREEIDLLRRAAKEDRQLDQHAFGRGDGEGGTVRLSLWNHPGDTIYGIFARCESIVNSAETLLEGGVYHYHSKMIMKDAKVGGAWAWHQDYGYWYQNGVLFPLLCSASIAVDPATRENGCLQVLRGSHNLGRIDHVLTGDQAGADLERVNEILKRLELVHVEMDPCDVLFFHANLLAPLRSEPVRQSAMVHDLLLQRGAEQSV